MRAGGSLEVFYQLPGALPAGGYDVLLSGYTADPNARLHAELLLRSGGADGGVDQRLASFDGMPPPPGGGLHIQPWLAGSACLGPLQAVPGDGLVLRITDPDGTSDFILLETSLTIP